MRPLDEHLSPQELAELPDTREVLTSSSEGQQIEQHLRQCEECMGLAHTHWRLRSLGASAAAGGEGVEKCPSETEWLEFALGLRASDADQMAEHAARCEICAAAWKEAMELAKEQPGEAEALAELTPTLASSSPEWQQNMVARLANQTANRAEVHASPVPKVSTVSPAPGDIYPQTASSRPRSSPRRPSVLTGWLPGPAWFQLTAVAAALVVAVLVGVFTWRSLNPSETRLLAMAYNKQRTLVLRVPGADPVPMASGTRAANSSLPETTELIELRLRAQKHLDQTPNSPYWHQVMGEIDLLHQDGLAARRNFEIAQTTDENLPNLLTDLAAAWFEVGDNTGNTEAYAQAAEFYSKELHRKPADPALLYYNRAICWERLSLTENALDDLRAALPLERSVAWQMVIQAEIDRLSTHSSATPNDGYETALAEATEKLLPQWSTSPEARASIERTAQLGLRHRDHWLTDWIHQKHTALELEADRHLASAVALGNIGDAEQSLAEAKKAITLYEQTQSEPGLVRAQLAQMHAFQRLARAADCLSSARSLESDRRVIANPELQAQVLIEKGDCIGRTGNLKAAEADYLDAESLSRVFSLPFTEIIAAESDAEALDALGKPSSAWRIDVFCMKACSRMNCSAKRKYGVIYNMISTAQEVGQNYVAATLMHTAERFAAASASPNLHAYAVETLGTLTGRVGDYGESEAAFLQAFSLAGVAHTPLIYKTLWETDQAEVLSLQGRFAQALELLDHISPGIRVSDYSAGRIAFFEQRAVSELALGQNANALADSKTAITEAERSLTGLRSSFERQEWARRNEAVYSTLVQIYLHNNDNASALRAWERFRSAPYSSESFPVTPKGISHAQAADVRILVIAHVDKQYIGWLANARTLEVERTVVLGNQNEIHQWALALYHLCADRDSSVSDIRRIGNRLYRSLLAPLVERTESSSRLWLDLDASLDLLPLSALEEPSGSWLGSSTQITLLPAWWTLRPLSDMQEPTFSPSVRMVILNGFAKNPDRSSEAVSLAKLFPRATSLDGTSISQPDALREISSAELFHFAGHADSRVEGKLLLSPSNRDTDPGLTPAVLSTVHLRSCRLAVLAACNTSSTDPDRTEDVRDLRDTLLLAGAHTVIASGWDVDDRSTHFLMLAFYKQLVQDPSPSRALQVAQSSITSTAEWQHPYYWAAFQTFTR